MLLGQGAAGFAAKRAAPRTSLGTLLAAALLLALPVHRPDLRLYPGSGPLLGFGLWNSLPATVALEYGLLAIGVWLHASGSRPRDRVGLWSF